MNLYKKLKCLALLLVVAPLLYLAIFSFLSADYHHLKAVLLTNKSGLKNNNSKNKIFLTDNPKCHIPELDPYDETLKKIIVTPSKFKCSNFPSIFKQYGNNLIMNWHVFNTSNLKNHIRFCSLSSISRPVSETSNNSIYIEKHLTNITNFSNGIKVLDEFVHIQCYNSKNISVYENYYSFVVSKQDVEKRCQERFRNTKELQNHKLLNVMVIGLDSVSRLNSIRYMPKVRNYLLKDMHAIEMNGYNKVGDNTIHNMVPFLTGKSLEELPWTEKERRVFDNYTFLWDEFSEKGYRTVFFEDYPEGAIFDYLKPGFHKTPTDYYNRHFHLSLNSKQSFWYHEKNCFVDRSQTEIVMHYTANLMKTFHSKPYFGFVFITRLTHDYLDRAAMADDFYIDFLKDVNLYGALNNTILIFMGDHGLRFGPIRQTYVGKMEERLPMLFIALPYWFKNVYPDMALNLEQNSHKLSTPFDMFETIMHVLSRRKPVDYQQQTKNFKRAYSLFDKTPLLRDCQNAGIDSHWCTCSRFQKIETLEKLKREANFLVNVINDKLQAFLHLCHYVQLESIVTAYEVIPYNHALQGSHTYQITVQVSPGGGVFEATLSKKENSFILNGDISRINAYGHQKRCNVDYKLEKFCYCKQILHNTEIKNLSSIESNFTKPHSLNLFTV